MRSARRAAWTPRREPAAPETTLAQALTAIQGVLGDEVVRCRAVLDWVSEAQVRAFVEVVQPRSVQDVWVAVQACTDSLDAVAGAFREASLADALGWAFVGAHGAVPQPGPYVIATVDQAVFTTCMMAAREDAGSGEWLLVAAGLRPSEFAAGRAMGASHLRMLAALREVRLPPT
jgi:hypothetical protein